MPTLALPDTSSVPVTLAPFEVAVILVVPATPIVTLAPDAIATFDVPFCIIPLLIVEKTPVAAPTLPKLALLVPVFSVPKILAPVPVTTKTVLPAAEILTLPFASGIFTLLVPLVILELLAAIGANTPLP